MPRSEFGEFLARSLATLARETPRSHERLCAEMEGRNAVFTVDGTPVLVSFGGGQVSVGPVAGDAPGIESALSKQTILDLVDGTVSLEDAILSDRFFLRASVADLQVFFGALKLYVNGAVRCPSMPALLEGYRRGDPDAMAGNGGGFS